MADKYGMLKQYFGYDTFRTGQEELVDGILAGQDVFGVMPTGAGKSLCFQLPAMLMEGITLVISPLISLMKDQVNSLTQAGIPAAYLNSSLTARQYRLALERAQQSAYKMIYVAPERLMTEEFQRFVQSTEISMVSVDEAHCVSQWGQDFRPSYLKIHEFISGLAKRPVISAFTATATAQVREDVIRLLELRDSLVITTGFDRSNLSFEVNKPKDKLAAIKHFWHANEGRSGIVYCSTRKAVEEVCTQLCEEGCPATRYHAGLTDAERRKNQDDFIFDRAPVMVATNAFGMGIDKSNVGFVVHYNMPKDMESYYQEAGRAGRDGEPARCVLYYSGQDVRTNLYFIEHGRENEELDEATRALFVQRDKDRLKAMTFYCFTDSCLRAYILLYFGEHSSGFCGNCGNCVRSTEEVDITLDVQKILSCIKRAGERFGAKLIVTVLRGGRTASADERVQKHGLDALSTFGVMSDVREEVIYDEIRFLEQEGYLVTSDDEYKVLRLADKAGEVLFQGKTLLRRLPEEKESGTSKKAKADQKIANPQLFEKLKKLRTKLANAQGVPAYAVFSDATLRGMCARLPQTRTELMEVSGVGVGKAERYGERFLAAIAEPDDVGSEVTRRTPFYLSEERKKQVELLDESVPISILTNQINAQIDATRMLRLSATKVTDWLLHKGILEEIVYENKKKARVASKSAGDYGIISEERENEDGGSYTINLYDREAQQFVLNSLDEIMEK